MTSDLALALDVPDAPRAEGLLQRLPADLRWVKIGSELFVREGPPCVASVKRTGRHVFLDLKFHDIPRTVAAAVRAATRLGVELLTVHATGGRDMIRAAVEAAEDMRGGLPVRILAVTALTSLAESDLSDLGVSTSVEAWTLRLAELALRSGAHGLVCSVQEVRTLRRHFGPTPFLATPGIRSASPSGGDQKRTGTVAEAIAAGSNLLIVGRPILEAADPAQAAANFLRQLIRAASP